MWPSSASSFARERNEYGKEPANSDGAFHVPPFAKPLTPFIKTRQEALRIRQALTLYLQSQIVFTDDDVSTSANCHAHLSLCVPHDAVVGVKRIPLELSGLRREYLKALQENVAAMQEYKAISGHGDVASGPMVSEVKVKAKSADATREGQENNGSSAVLQEYIAFLHDRRLYEKLQVFQHYLNKLSERGGSLLDIAGTGGDQHERLRRPGIDENATQDNGRANKAEEDLEELVFTLEKAVIRAKTQLDREKELLKELKGRWELSGETRNDVSSATRITALRRTRDELIRWVEEKLVASGGDDDGPLLQDIPQDDGHDSASLIEEGKRQIEEQYAAYIKARKSLLETVSVALQPTTNGGTTVSSPSLPGVTRQSLAPSRSKLGDLLLYTSEVLHPLTKVQRSLALQKSYLSGLLAKEKLTARRILDRLSSESHLLPEYPLLARQPRFKHIATAIGPRSRQRSEQQLHKADEIVSHAQAWAFASEAARMNEREYVEQKTGLGGEMADSAHETLKEVYEILNQNLDEVTRDKDEEHDTQDIWATDLRLTRYQTRQPRGERRVKGPWSGLNGRVGILGDL